MFHLIPSKDVREYMERNGREFTDFEKSCADLRTRYDWM